MFEFLRSLFHEKSSYAPKKEHDDRLVFQFSTVNALMEGLYEGSISYGELFKHGDFGLGTFDSLDGEMVALDGHFYQIKDDGKLSIVNAEQRSPFAVLVHFKPDMKYTIDTVINYKLLQEEICSRVSSLNYIYAIRVDAEFERVDVRVAPRQCKPYPVMTEAAKDQAEFSLTDVKGTICGFRFPAYTSNINVPGYHMHFINDARTTGGHMFDARLSNAVVQVERLSGFFMQLPESSEFMHADLSADRAKEIKSVEGKRS